MDQRAGRWDAAVASRATRTEHARLAQLAHDLDPRVEVGTRVASAVLVLAMMFGFVIYASQIDRLTAQHAFGFSLVLLAGLTTLLLVQWRRITSTTFNRRLAAWVAIATLTLVTHRGLALVDDTSIPKIFSTDLLILACAWASGSLFMARWMLAIGIGLALCAIPTLLVPAVGVPLFAAANLISIVAFVVGWRRTGNQRQ